MARTDVQYFQLRPSKISLEVLRAAEDTMEGCEDSGMADTLDGRNLDPLMIVCSRNFDMH